MLRGFSVILPCYNESKNIPLIVEKFQTYWPKYNFELILVNNGSLDNSQEVLEDLQLKYPDIIRIIKIEKNIGYGHGVFEGLKQSKSNIVSYSHADIQTPPEDIFKAFDIYKEQAKHREKILVKGLRLNRRSNELFLAKSLAKVVKIILGYNLEDINGQPKMFSKVLLDSFVNPPTDFSFDVYVMYKAKCCEYELVTFPVDFGARIHGESNWGGTILAKYKTILKYLVSINKMAIKNCKQKYSFYNKIYKFVSLFNINIKNIF
ncbi:glycosyltransferase family 2 protein [bacterium]